MTGVVIGFMFNERVSGYFAHCLADLIRVDSQGHNYVGGKAGGLISISTGPRVAEGRNRLIDEFASQYGEGSEWLLMLDTDMTFPGTLLDQLMAVADPEKVPILGGLCFTGGRGHEPKPTIYREVVVGEMVSVRPVLDYPRDALVKVGATGAACMLMHRSALGAMKNHFETTADGKHNPYPWFAEGIVGPEGDAWGEDILFCLRANALGIPVHVLTSAKLGHIKPTVIDEVFFDNWHRDKHLDDLTEKATGEYDAIPGEDGIIDVVASNGDPVPEYGANRAERRRLARERARMG
jgi:hypothetical protein